MFLEYGTVNVLARHDADQFSLFHDRQAMEAAGKHKPSGAEDGGVNVDRDNLLRHIFRNGLFSDVSDLFFLFFAVAKDVGFQDVFFIEREHGAKKIFFRNDADQLTFVVHDRYAADIFGIQQKGGIFVRCVGRYRYDRCYHNFSHFHISPSDSFIISFLRLLKHLGNPGRRKRAKINKFRFWEIQPVYRLAGFLYNRSMKKKVLVALSLIAVVASCAPGISEAAYFKTGKSVVVGSSAAINDNVYAAGASVSVSAPVEGDLLAAGGTLYISGPVSQDIMIAGGTVIVAGSSAQNIRIIGGNVTVSGTYKGEAAVAGGQVAVMSGTTITKDSYLAGGSVTFAGNEAGNLSIAGDAVYIDGTVEGNLTVKGGKQVTIGPNAVIKGNFDYTAQQKATIEGGAQILGTTTFHEAKVPAETASGFFAAFAAILTIGWIAKLLMVLTAAYLLWYLCRSDMVETVKRIASGFWKELLRGFLLLVATPIAAIILLATVLGILPGVIVFLLYGALLVVSAPVAGIVVASLLKKLKTDLRWYHILLGVVVFEIVKLIPFIGWIATFIVYLLSVGAFAMVVRQRFGKRG